MISNTMEISDKTNNRTHHTRFFEKLYGNLEKSCEKKDESKILKNLHPQDRQERLNSPSESSGSSSEIFSSEINVPRCEQSQRLNPVLRVLIKLVFLGIRCFLPRMKLDYTISPHLCCHHTLGRCACQLDLQQAILITTLQLFVSFPTNLFNYTYYKL